MGHSTEHQTWTINEQTVSDPVTGLTLEFKVNQFGEPTLTLYGDRLVFGNRTIVFEDDSTRVHGETVIPTGPTSFQTAAERRGRINAPR